MISENSLKQISRMFCGDIEGYFSYKLSSQLVAFFNRYYNTNDAYAQRSHPRWEYVYNKLVELIAHNKINTFFDIILSRDYLMSEQWLSSAEAAQKSEIIWNEFNRIVQQDQCKITRKDNKHHLVRERDDLVLIGGGSLSNIYRQKSTGFIVKKLKDDFLTDKNICNRFKQEYIITKSLQGIFGIINVHSFDEGNSSYLMDPAQTTLKQYVKNNDLPQNKKINCIRQILYTMSEIHKRNVVHRNLSDNNILMISGLLKIADFSLGKNLNLSATNQTADINATEQYLYCAPEQFTAPNETNKRSDVFSLGRLMNFIMTKDPKNSQHIFKNISNKATNSDASCRYEDADKLLNDFEKVVAIIYRQTYKQINDEMMWRQF